MSYYCEIFDQQLSAMIFEVLTLAFLACYGLVAVWAAA